VWFNRFDPQDPANRESTMFHSIVVILTTTSVMLHAFLGCCAHHAHACDDHQRGNPKVVQSACDGHEHHHHKHQYTSPCQSDSGEGEDQQGRQEPCDSTACSFVSAERTDDLTKTLTSAIWLSAICDVSPMMTLHESFCCQMGALSPSDSLPAPQILRAHAQVWLL
jgi:hypothetical protein